MAFFSSDSVGKVGLFCLRALGFQVVKILCKQNVILELCLFSPLFFLDVSVMIPRKAVLKSDLLYLHF